MAEQGIESPAWQGYRRGLQPKVPRAGGDERPGERRVGRRVGQGGRRRYLLLEGEREGRREPARRILRRLQVSARH